MAGEEGYACEIVRCPDLDNKFTMLRDRGWLGYSRLLYTSELSIGFHRFEEWF